MHLQLGHSWMFFIQLLPGELHHSLQQTAELLRQPSVCSANIDKSQNAEACYAADSKSRSVWKYEQEYGNEWEIFY